ncbi:invasion associated locus B family protein [Altererythrobacter sp. ZODW24]|uniref:invasion associated locus B family protein n=1 Tax=Altererythrobacter sp. ZODW24 TaxID=2185142 RepID=UPI000DF7FFBD|nr:invasion associated locus B family protein [Altererythrobacter sp. ZODW24]
MRFGVVALAVLVAAVPAAAKDGLGVFDSWAAFRDAETPRCYAIAKARSSSRSASYKPYATVGTWPKRGIRGQVHFRLSSKLAAGSTITLKVSEKSFTLTGGGADAWARDKTMDAAIVAAMRSASQMTVRAKSASGSNIVNTYNLGGAATAMDAATVGCANLR